MTSTPIRTEKFTRRDYMQLPEGFPAELIDGDFVKEPAPTYWHQGLVSRLVARLLALAGPERVLVSPIDLLLDDWNVFQPDVLVRAVGDEVTGPGAESRIPILVVEVLSPSTAQRDRETKSAAYVRAGVAEVWLVDPEHRAIEVHTTRGVHEYPGAAKAVSQVVEGFALSWDGLAANA